MMALFLPLFHALMTHVFVCQKILQICQSFVLPLLLTLAGQRSRRRRPPARVCQNPNHTFIRKTPFSIPLESIHEPGDCE